MTMQNMKKLALLLVTGLMFTSCSDLLDTEPYDKFTKQNYFTSETNVKLFANYFYNTFTGYGSGSGDYYFNTLNDDQASTGITNWTFTSVPGSSGAWNTPYVEIRRANTLISAVPGIESMSEAAKNNWIGIGRLYRAWQHYKLVRAYGDCYYVDKELDATDEDILYGPRQPRNDVMDKVLEDLNFAVANITADANSRVAYNKWVALAMKAEICLFEGTYSKYVTKNASRATTYLTEAKAACQQIMASGNFELNSDYKSNFDDDDLSGNKEMILYKHYVQGIMGHGTIDYTCGSTQVNGMTKDAFNAYLSDEGDLMAYGDDHGTLVNGKPNVGAQIAKRDPRLAAHVDAALQFPGNGVARYADDPTTEAGKNASESTSSTGYGVLKFDTKALDRVRRQSIGQGDTDAPIFWLAVIYLNYAEAKAELGEFDGTVQSLTLDKLRARAGNIWGFTVVSDPRKNMNVSDLIYEIRRERRIELMYDINDRYYALQRWHCLYLLDTQKYPDQKKGAWIGTSADADKLFDVDAAIAAGASHPDIDAEGYIDCSSGNNRIYNNKYYLFPIPSDQQTLNPEIGQNYGW